MARRLPLATALLSGRRRPVSRAGAAVLRGLALLCLLAPCQAQPLLTAYRAPAPPLLDGVTDDACWQVASVGAPFLSAQSAEPEPQQTRVQVCFDDDHLYLAVEAFDELLEPRLNMLHLVRAEKTGRDANVFSDDCVEVFLAPTARSYYHFAANSGTGTYEAEGKDDSWSCDWRSVARRGDRSYTVEMAIPLAALGAVGQEPWGLNVTRTRSADGRYSTWSGLQRDFHQPAAFGRLQFSAQGPALGEFTHTRQQRELAVSARVAGAADGDTALRCELTAGQAAEATGPGEHILRLPLQMEAVVAGTVGLTVSLLQDGRVMARSAVVPVSCAAGVLDWSVAARDAAYEAFVNGAPVDPSRPDLGLELPTGLSVLCLRAKATGAAPAVMPRIEANGLPLQPRWLAASEEPAAGWLTDIQATWPQASAGAEGLWSAPDATEAYLTCGVYVPQPGPQLFPKQDVCYLPAGSRQLVRLYLHDPRGCPSEGYTMVVQAPPELRYVANEPIGSAKLQVRRGPDGSVAGNALARHELRYEALPGTGLDINLRWGDAAGATLAYQPGITGGGTCDWRRIELSVTPPAGAQSVHPLVIKWQDRGITGTFWVDNLSFHEVGSEENLLKMGTFDEPQWGADSLLVPEGPDGSRCVKVVATPELVDRQQALWVDKEGVVPVEPGKTYVLAADVKCRDLGSPDARAQAALLFEAPGELQPGELDLYTHFEALDGAVVEIPQRSAVRILPPLRNVRPARARICPCLYGPTFNNPDVAAAFAENCYASGIRWTYGRTTNEVVPHLLDRGHRVFLSIPWEPWHAPPGMAESLKQTPECQAVDFSGKSIQHAYCPTWLLAEGQEPLEALETWLVSLVNGGPYPAANWDIEQPVVDPPTFCACGRCKAAFRRAVGLPEDLEITSDSLTGQYREEWTDFRCAQNARMAGKIKQMLAGAEHPVEFSVYSGYQSQRTREHYGVDWAALAPHLDFAIAGYNGDRGAIRATLEALGDVPFMGGEMWYLSPTGDGQAPPRMETWCQRLLRQYMESGGNGCLIWYLPPMDGGAFYATSEAAALIAEYEDYFRLARRCDERVQVTGIGATDWAAFAGDGTILVVTLNFADKPAVAAITAEGRTVQVDMEPYGYQATVLKTR